MSVHILPYILWLPVNLFALCNNNPYYEGRNKKGEKRKMVNNWKTIEGKRYNIASMTVIWAGHKEIGTGFYRNGIYLMPRSKKVIVNTYSIWENPRTHGCYGDNFYIADDEQVANLANETNDSRLLALVPEAADS
jgi:hypothetical protein